MKNIEDIYLEKIKEINLQIKELQSEKEALNRLLLKIRRDNLNLHDVNRRNSTDRILIEKIIVDKLIESNNNISSNELLKVTAFYLPDIKGSSFRVYLHRMKERGIIKNPKGERGLWLVADKKLLKK